MIAATGVVAAAPGAELLVVAPDGRRASRELPHAEGDRVKAGDLLVQVRHSVAGRRRRGKSSAGHAGRRRASRPRKPTFTRLSSLLEQGVAAPRDVEDAKRQQRRGRSRSRAGAERRAGRGRARRTGRRACAIRRASSRSDSTTPGDLVEAAASDPVLKVINPSQLQVVAAVPASELSRVVVGHAAQMRQAGSRRGREAREGPDEGAAGRSRHGDRQTSGWRSRSRPR